MIMLDTDIQCFPKTTRFFQRGGFQKDAMALHYVNAMEKFTRMKRSLYSWITKWGNSPVMFIVTNPDSWNSADFNIEEGVVRQFEAGTDLFCPYQGPLQGRRIHLLTAHVLSRMVQHQITNANEGRDGQAAAEEFDNELFGDTCAVFTGRGGLVRIR